MKDVVFKRLLQSEPIRLLEHELAKGSSLLLEGLWNSPKAAIASLAAQATGKHIVILTGASQEEIRLFHDFSFFTLRPVIDFPAWETLPAENIPPSPDIVGERYHVLATLKESKEPHIILTTLQACLQKLIPRKLFESLYLHIKQGDTFSLEGLIEKFVSMGYQRKAVAADKGEFAVRGGIIDIFPVSTPDPYRLEFWGDEIESLRIYDPIGQKSIKQVKELQLTPGQELELLNNKEQLETLLDYLGENTLLIFDDLLALEDRYASLIGLSGTSSTFLKIEEFMEKAFHLQSLFFSQTAIEKLSEVKLLDIPGKGFYSKNTLSYDLAFQMFNREIKAKWFRSPFKNVLELLFPEEQTEEISGQEILKQLETLPKETTELIFLCETEAEETKLQKQIVELKLPKKTVTEIGYLSSGFSLEEGNLFVLPLTEITHRYKIRRQKQRSTYHTTYSETFDLIPGDMIVHFNHGIGRFLGIEKKPNHEGILNEFFHIEYAEGAKLFVPVYQSHLLSKYIGAGEEEPKMHVLGGSRWKRTREETQRAITGYANELLEMYAKREIKGGVAFPEDTSEMLSFEEDFPYVETEDQLRAIAEIKNDMKLSKSMDRLICGDVGYGKTEVAMRAAFKACMEGGKQVAVLVPTTVLAMQHYENFLERMANFPINIAVLSRFRTQKEIRETLQKIEQGSVDIVVGTHRIVSEDVKFKDLGLVIVDEEQRFGVKAKEHLKKIKTGVDCLTLSATPIPRTLYMSLVGARDMSVINTPPQDRLPIKTIIAEPCEQLIRSALLRELSRDGQAYVIHNRVETIYEMAGRIKELLPNARVVIGHGQMTSEELDQVFHAFKSGRADILVATTIVENGIDIPNANTILIDRADRFGLADLYQLRGRVGRWNRRAYAYFLVPSLRSLPEISRKRLNALAESAGYGGGMKVAMRDLEIRGAGDLLGIEQSGHVSSVGFHLYCKMLKRTIKTIQGKAPQFLADTKIEIPVDARLPETYVNDITLRMEFYQRLGEAFSLPEVDEIFGELIDRFGVAPEAAEWLYQMSKLRVFAALNGFTLIKKDRVSLSVQHLKAGKTETKAFLMASFKKPSDVESSLIPLLKKEFSV